MPEDAKLNNWAQFLVSRLQIVPWTHPLAHAVIMEADPGTLSDQFQISLLRESATEVTLRFIPRLPQDQVFFREVHVMLILKEYRLRAIKFVGHGSETVYVLSDGRTNWLQWAPVGDLGHPDLRGYRKAIAP